MRGLFRGIVTVNKTDKQAMECSLREAEECLGLTGQPARLAEWVTSRFSERLYLG